MTQESGQDRDVWADQQAAAAPRWSREKWLRINAILGLAPSDSDGDASAATDSAQAAAALFLDMTAAVAQGRPHEAVQLLLTSADDDPAQAYLDQIKLATLAPLIIGLGLRRLGYAPEPGQLCAIHPPTAGEEIEERLVLQLLAEILNSPTGAGAADYVADTILAHIDKHGPAGLARLMRRLLSTSAWVWHSGGYTLGEGGPSHLNTGG